MNKKYYHATLSPWENLEYNLNNRKKSHIGCDYYQCKAGPEWMRGKVYT